jgi:hypothetical protein
MAPFDAYRLISIHMQLPYSSGNDACMIACTSHPRIHGSPPADECLRIQLSNTPSCSPHFAILIVCQLHAACTAAETMKYERTADVD